LADHEIAGALLVGKTDHHAVRHQLRPMNDRGYRVNVMLPAFAVDLLSTCSLSERSRR
jgi:hypothetical protein